MIEHVLPDGLGLVHAQERGVADAPLLPAEAAAVARAVESRRREYAAVRALARTCLVELGHAAAAIPSGPGREPVWPDGIVGSLTHCDGYRAAVLARATDVVAVGIDAETDAPLPDGVLAVVASPDERRRLDAAGSAHLDRVLFSAKESVFKAWWPLVGAWLDFLEADVTVSSGARRDDVLHGAFVARLLRDGLELDGRPADRLEGRWAAGRGLVVTAVVVPQPRRPGT